MLRTVSFIALACLAACSSPQQLCLDEVGRELRVLRSLVAQSEATLKRGYAVRTETEVIAFTTFCDDTDTPHENARFCDQIAPITTQVQMAIDPAEEARKLQYLKKQEMLLEAETRRAIWQCKASHSAK